MAPDPVLVCRIGALRPEERDRHAELLSELKSSIRGVEERPDGYAFRFPGEGDLFRRLAEWATLERVCCPFLGFELLLEPDGGAATLRLSGPPGTRELLRAELGLEGRAPGGTPEIGLLRPEETPELLALLERCGLPEAGVRDHLGAALVAREEGRIVGSAVLELSRDGALLRSVGVDPAFRGTGLGTRLTERALSLAGEKGARRVFLLTETAGNFFPRFGFRRIDRAQVPGSVRESREFQGACPETALVMERSI